MLKKKKRVTKKTFQEIFKNGKTISTPFFLFKYLKNKEPQYSFVVSKKIAKNAVLRNKLKRFGYNTLRNNTTENKGIFFFKKNIENLEKEAKEDIFYIINKTKQK